MRLNQSAIAILCFFTLELSLTAHAASTLAPAARKATVVEKRRPSAVQAPEASIEEEDNDAVPENSGLLMKLPIKEASEDLVGLYSNPDAAPIAKMIDSARETLDIEIYEMADGDVLDAITRARSRKVKVRIIKDPASVGQKCNPFYDAEKASIPQPGKKKSIFAAGKAQRSRECQSYMKWVGQLKTSQEGLPDGEIRPFNREVLCGGGVKHCFEHGKMILVDHKTAAISTGNFNSTSLCNLKYRPEKCNRDYTYITKDREVLKALSEIFEGDWKSDPSALKTIVERGQLPKKITVSPYSFQPLREMILKSESKLQIQNQYITDMKLVQTLVDVMMNNPELDVEVNLLDVCEFGSITPAKKAKTEEIFNTLTQAGVKLKLFPKGQKIRGKNGYLHAKAIVVDGRRAWIGSINGSDMSFNRNREFGIFFSQPTRVKELARQMTEDFNNTAALDASVGLENCPVRKAKKKPTKSTGSDLLEEDEG